MTTNPSTPHTYEVGVRQTDWRRQVMALTAGKAKADYFRDVRDCWPDVKYTDIVCRVIGGPVTDSEFERTATYRNVPFARVGMRVQFVDDGAEGVIAGKNSSANFDVLFVSGKNKGLTLNCHPNWMIRYLDDAGKTIQEFGGSND